MNYNIIIAIVLTAIISYCIGSIMFAVIISKKVYGKDIRTLGSKNPGTSNMSRNFGKKGGLTTFAGDMLKGTVAVLVCTLMAEHLFDLPDIYVKICTYLASMCALAGHVFPVFYGFKGGKGVATGVGCIFAINPILAPILIGLFGLGLYITGYFSIGSIVGTVAFPILQVVFSMTFQDPLHPLDIVMSLVLTGVVLFMHRANFVRLAKGTETRMSFKNKNKDKK